MKLLDKRIIDKKKADEHKIEIDEGIHLATTIDKLREQLQTEKKNLLDWRETNIKKVQEEIAEEIAKRESIKRENDEARKVRTELLKPLDKEWTEINKEKNQLIKDKDDIYLSGEQLKIAEQNLKTRENDISIIVSKVKRNETETEKTKSEAISLKEMAQREYEIASEERGLQTANIEKALSEVKHREEEYKVALSTIEAREKEIEEKESELLVREKHLESQQATLRIAYEKIKQNVNS